MSWEQRAFTILGLGTFAGLGAVGALSGMGNATDTSARGPTPQGPSQPTPPTTLPSVGGQKGGGPPANQNARYPMTSVTTSEQQLAEAGPMAKAGVPYREGGAQQDMAARIAQIAAKYPQAMRQPQAPPAPYQDPNLGGQAREVLSSYFGKAAQVPPQYGQGQGMSEQQRLWQQMQLQKQMQEAGVYGPQAPAMPMGAAGQSPRASGIPPAPPWR